MAQLPGAGLQHAGLFLGLTPYIQRSTVMQVAPNRSVFRGQICAIHHASDGWGADIDLLVTANESPTAEQDFVRPSLGAVITVFTAHPAHLRVGEQVRVQANLAAGPFGRRVVAQALTKV